MIQSFMKRNIDVSVRTGDIRQIDADVVALKYSQELIGAAQAVAQALGKTSSDMPALLPSLGSTHLFPGRGLIQARHALFLSVVPLRSFDYAEVRQFGFDALKRPGHGRAANPPPGYDSPGRRIRIEPRQGPALGASGMY